VPFYYVNSNAKVDAKVCQFEKIFFYHKKFIVFLNSNNIILKMNTKLSQQQSNDNHEKICGYENYLIFS
jgi:hypothetical protein